MQFSSSIAASLILVLAVATPCVADAPGTPNYERADVIGALAAPRDARNVHGCDGERGRSPIRRRWRPLWNSNVIAGFGDSV